MQRLLDRICITSHARQRAQEMGVAPFDLIAAMTDPEVRYEQSWRGPGMWLYQRGQIAVAIRETAEELVALSVLPRVTEVYTR